MEHQKARLPLRRLIIAALMTAVIAVLSQIAIPLPVGVPLTLQTLAVAVTGYLLGPVMGAASVGAYLLLGVVGAPVFASFGGGAGVLFGLTGGFLFGFLPLAFLCGLGAKRRTLPGMALGLAGLLLCHAAGTLWFAFVGSRGIADAFLVVSLPYLPKDAVSVAAAYLFAALLRRRVKL